MSIITTLLNSATGLVFRTALNTNFTNLNTDKAEDLSVVHIAWIETITGNKTFSGILKTSSPTGLQIATGGGSTPDAINIWSGGAFLGQINGNMEVRSAFTAKNFNFKDSSSASQFSISLDSWKQTFLTTANKPAWTATLVAGTITINNTIITANSIIMISRSISGGTPWYFTYTKSAGTSFTVTSTSTTDTSTFDYIIFN